MKNFTQKIRLWTLLAIVAVSQNVSAQDPQFSQVYNFASYTNPALVGNYNGSYRLAAVYRNQWGSALSRSGYETVGADVDFSFLEGYLRNSKLAAGIGFMNDRAGTAGLNHMNVSFTLAYHQAFGKDGDHRLSIGLQGAFIQKRLNDPIFYDQFRGFEQSYGLTQEKFTRGVYNGDFNAGLYWKSNFKNKVKFGIGAAGYHLIEPKEDMIKDLFMKTGNQYRKITADVNVEAFFGKDNKMSISPEFLVMLQGPARKFNPGIFFGYYFQSAFRKNNSLHVGARARVSDAPNITDAIIPTVSVEFRNIRLGVSYDVNISKLQLATQNRGAFEISLSYVGESIKYFKGSKSLPSRRF